MSSTVCIRCGAPRRTDGLAFCPSCGAWYADSNAPKVALRKTPALSHPWMIFIAVVAVAGVVAITLSRSTIVQIGSVTTAERIPAIAFWLIGWLLYWVPTLVAIFRRRIPVWPVALFNLISGWTVVGWFTVLWFATTGRTYEQLSPRASG